MSGLQADILRSSGQPSANAEALDLNAVGTELRYDVRRYSTASVAAVKLAAWATAVLTVYGSIDGVNAFALETPETLGPGSDMTGTIDTSSLGWLIVRVTTAEGSAVEAKVSALGKYAT